MSVNKVWNVEWLNGNAQRKYPLSEEASGYDVSGVYQIANDLIVDFVMPIPTIDTIDQSLFHIQQLAIFSNGVSISIGYNGTQIGSTTITAAAHTVNSVYSIQCNGDFYDSVARIVIGDLANTVDGTNGVFIFNVTGGRLEPVTIRPALRGIQSVRVKNGSTISAAISGDIILEAGANQRLRVDGTTIYIDAINGAGLVEECECTDDNDQAPCIKTINGIAPDENGNFVLEGDDCYQLVPIDSGLSLTDLCSNPCCGCDELSVVTDALVMQENNLAQLSGYAQRLEAVLTQLQLAFTAAQVQA